MSSDPGLRLSVVIPCYNTGKYIGRCLDSLLPLCDRGVEVIIIDDCSTDDTAALTEAALESRPQLRAVTMLLRNETNRGLASTRLRGISEARGNYILHVDSDDFIDAGPVAEALDLAEKTDADCVVSPFREIRDGRVKIRVPGDLTNLNRVKIDYVNLSLCNKLLRRELIISEGLLQYPGLDRWEDVGVTSRLLALKPRIVTFGTPWYNYMIDTSRTTLSSFRRAATVEGRAAIACKAAEWLAGRGLAEEYEPFLCALKFYAKAGYLRGGRPDISSWRRTFPEIHPRLLSLSQIPLSYRIIGKILSLF